MAVMGKNRIMIYGPKDDGTYAVEFKTAAGDALAISIPRTEAGAMNCRRDGGRKDRTPMHGYEDSREAAMAAFAKSWRRE